VNSFFQVGYSELVASPNQRYWWHSMPLPDGTRISGANPDKDWQFKMWQALRIPSDGGLAGKSVLDIGANDGFFTLAAHMAGARDVTAINSADWSGWPENIEYACRAWGTSPDIVTADFRRHPFHRKFDVVFFFGVLYHLEDVFGCMRVLDGLLADDGVLYIETQMTSIPCDLPIFESASDIYPTTAGQCKSSLGQVGVSNYLFPNEHAIRNLAYSYDFHFESLSGPHNRYTQENPTRCFFKFVKVRG
jgi:SAM-dependent methyltransferase